MKPSVAFWISIVILIASACSPFPRTAPGGTQTGLEITSTVTSIGAADGNPAESRFSYTVMIFNASGTPQDVAWVEPVVTEPFSAYLTSNNTRQSVQETIAAEDVLEVRGELQFDFSDLSKEEIEAMGPILAGFEVSSERFLPLSG
jgi:hypothetical protein